MSDRMPHFWRSSPMWYGVALGVAIATESLRLHLPWRWGAVHWLITFLPAIMASAWWGGFGPGVVSTVASALLVAYFDLPPRFSFRVEDASELIGLVALVGIGLVVSVLARKDRR